MLGMTAGAPYVTKMNIGNEFPVLAGGHLGVLHIPSLPDVEVLHLSAA